MAIRDTKVEGIPAEAFQVGVALAQVAPRIVAHLVRLRPTVLRLDEDLRPYFGGARPSEALDARKRALDDADATQEVQRTALPKQTARLHQAKAELLGAIEDLYRVARIAFPRESPSRKVFGLSILRRGRRASARRAIARDDAPVG